jgi:hypothetical protein
MDELQTAEADNSKSKNSDNFVSRLWPAVLIPIGSGMTIVWVCFLGYWLIELVDLVI